MYFQVDCFNSDVKSIIAETHDEAAKEVAFVIMRSMSIGAGGLKKIIKHYHHKRNNEAKYELIIGKVKETIDDASSFFVFLKPELATDPLVRKRRRQRNTYQSKTCEKANSNATCEAVQETEPVC